MILKALEKQPAMRFQTCRVMGEALQDSLTAETTPEAPTQARRPEGLADLIQAGTVERSIRLILADDHRVLRKALVSELEARPEFVVVAEAGDGEAALLKTIALLPDVLLLDLNMPGKGGLDVLPEIRAQAPSVKVLVLTGREESGYIVRALRAGANGYVLKSSDENELIEAIIKVHEGELVLGRGVTEKVVTGLLKDQSSEATNEINETERRVLLFVARGFDNEAIAQRLDLSMPMVIETLASAMDKLDANDRNEAALLALRDGYILLDEVHTLS